MDDSIIEMQIKIEQQAEEIANLSKELYTQQKELALLKQQVAALTAQFLALEDSGIVKNIADETPPPHY